MRGFGSFVGAARFCTAFDEVRNFFRVRSTAVYPLPSLAEQRQTFQQRWNDLWAGWQTR